MKEREEAIKILREDSMFKTLSKEIVHYIQTYGSNTQKCVDFVLYELHLRCLDKNLIGKLAEQNEPSMEKGQD